MMAVAPRLQPGGIVAHRRGSAWGDQIPSRLRCRVQEARGAEVVPEGEEAAQRGVVPWGKGQVAEEGRRRGHARGTAECRCRWEDFNGLKLLDGVRQENTAEVGESPAGANAGYNLRRLHRGGGASVDAGGNATLLQQ